MDYLEAQNRRLAGLPASGPDARGQRVIILGGGDTGSDCLGTALRQGAASVTQVELLPAPPAARVAGNPWPQWPLIFRTSSSQEEGGAREFALKTVRLSAREGRLAALHAVRVEVTPGGLRELGEEVTLEADLLVLAMGFVGPELGGLREELGPALDARGNLQVDAHGRTSVSGVYAAGDASRGASLIVWAIADGRRAARAVDADLRR
jgi:glutamate synthase (NADPH/NADH) small chain